MICFKKNTLFLLAFLSTAVLNPAFANQNVVNNGMQDCRQAQKLAQDVMFYRQDGANIEELKRVFARSSSSLTRKEAERLADMSLSMLDNASDKPVETGLARKYLASKDFSRTTYAQCIDEKVSRVIL